MASISEDDRCFGVPMADYAMVRESAHAFEMSVRRVAAAHGRAILEDVLARDSEWGADTLDGPMVYTGAAGAALLLVHLALREHDASRSIALATRCAGVLDKHCLPVLHRTRMVPTLLCGEVGVYAIAAVAASIRGDSAAPWLSRIDACVSDDRVLAADGALPYELLYGRAGLLAALLFVRQHVPTLPDRLTAAVERVCTHTLTHGHAGAAALPLAAGALRPPLMYTWHGKMYLGAAHGVCGIAQMLGEASTQLLAHTHTHTHTHTEAKSLRDECSRASKQCLSYLSSPACTFASGNLRSSVESSSDRLVHWCHGATGAAIALADAYMRSGDDAELEAARRAADVVWRRGLLRRASLCHGVAGSMYAFLAVRRALHHAASIHTARAALLEEEAACQSYRAHAFAHFLMHGPAIPTTSAAISAMAPPAPGTAYWQQLVKAGAMHGGDCSWSLFEGSLGVACALLDLSNVELARFPGFQFLHPAT